MLRRNVLALLAAGLLGCKSKTPNFRTARPKADIVKIGTVAQTPEGKVFSDWGFHSHDRPPVMMFASGEGAGYIAGWHFSELEKFAAWHRHGYISAPILGSPRST